jgi:hypothetical protein
MRNYLDVIQAEIDTVTEISNILAKAIKQNTDIEESKEFVTQFIFPFVVYHKEMRKIQAKIFSCFFDLRYEIQLGHMDQKGRYMDFKILKMQGDSALFIKSKLYYVLSFFCNKSIEVDLVDVKIPIIKANHLLRNKIKLEVSKKNHELAYLVDFFPLTILEGLIEKIYHPFPISRYIYHTFEMTRKEVLIYALVYAKLKHNTKVIGAPHGAAYYQTAKSVHPHVVEINQSDIYAKPRFSKGAVENTVFIPLPIFRVVSGFINFFPKTSWIGKNNNKPIVLIIPLIDEYFFKNLNLNQESLIKKLLLIKDKHPNMCIKIHPLQNKIIEISYFLECLYSEFCIVDILKFKDYKIVLFGEEQTMMLELLLQRDEIYVMKIGSLETLDQGFYKTIYNENKSYKELDIIKVNKAKLLKQYNLTLKGIFYFFYFHIRALNGWLTK